MSRPARRAPAPRPKPATPAIALHSRAELPAVAWLSWAAWALIAAVGAALLGLVLGPHDVGDIFTETDFYGAYAEGARQLLRGQIDPSRYAVVGPGFEIALAAVGLLVRDLFVAAECIALLSTVGTLWLWHRTFARRVNPAFALLGVAFMATNAQLFRYGWAVTTDAFAMLLVAAAACLLLATKGPRAMFAAGLLAGAATLTRYTAAVLLPCGMLAIALGWTLHERPLSRRRQALLFAAGFAVLVAPWVAWSLSHGGGVQVQLHHNIAYEVFARAKGIAWDVYQREMQPQFPTPWSVLAKDPGAVIGRIAWNAFDHLRLDAKDLLGWPVALAAALGLVLAALDGTLRRLAGLWLIALALHLALVPAFHSPRYALILLPMYAALAAAAFTSPRFAMMVGRWWLKPALAVVPLALAMQTSIAQQRLILSQLPHEVLRVASAARARIQPDDRVMARKPHFAYHAGLTPVAFPYVDSLPALAATAREARARWLYFSWPELEMRPMFGWMLDTTATIPGLTLRAYEEKHPAALYEIGPEFGRAPDWFANDTLRAVHMARARTKVILNDLRELLLVGTWERDHGRADIAQPYFERAATWHPRDATVQMMLGDNLLTLARHAESERAFTRAESLQPGNAYARMGRGWAVLMQGRDAEAAALWRPLVSGVQDPAMLARMAELYARVGDEAAAGEARERLRQMAGAR